MLFGAADPISAHEEHDEKAERASSEETAAEEAATPHDHADHGAPMAPQSAGPPLEREESLLPKPLAWIGKFHPAVTHFPIALLASAVLAELLFLRTHNVAYHHVVLFCVRFGAGAAILAAALGWLFAGLRLVDDEWVMTAHRWAGTTTALLGGGLLYLVGQMESPTGPGADARARFRIALLCAAGLVGATGFLGGALLYGLDHYAW
jgi:uncharacterized membrane protein